MITKKESKHKAIDRHLLPLPTSEMPICQLKYVTNTVCSTTFIAFEYSLDNVVPESQVPAILSAITKNKTCPALSTCNIVSKQPSDKKIYISDKRFDYKTYGILDRFLQENQHVALFLTETTPVEAAIEEGTVRFHYKDVDRTRFLYKIIPKIREIFCSEEDAIHVLFDKPNTPNFFEIIFIAKTDSNKIDPEKETDYSFQFNNL